MESFKTVNVKVDVSVLETKTTTSIKYVLEGLTHDTKHWAPLHYPADSKIIAKEYEKVGHCLFADYRIVEIVTTTTVSKRVMEEPKDACTLAREQTLTKNPNLNYVPKGGIEPHRCPSKTNNPCGHKDCDKL